MHLRTFKNSPKNEKILFSVNFGFGFNWLFQENMAIFGQPNLRYYLTPNHGIGFKENRITGGIEFGIRKYLN
jgi:hypothetical protein